MSDKILNFTPKTIIVRTKEGDVEFPPCGTVLGVRKKELFLTTQFEVDGKTIYVYTTGYCLTVNGKDDCFLPDEFYEEGRICIVTREVAEVIKMLNFSPKAWILYPNVDPLVWEFPGVVYVDYLVWLT